MKNRKNNPNIPANNIIAIVVSFALFFVFIGGILLATNFLGKTGSSAYGGSTDIFFSEIMSGNSASFYSAEAGLCDWVEVYNASSSAVDLGGYTIASSASNMSFTFPDGTVIEANGYYVVCCTDNTYGASLAPFTIARAGGETLVLKNKNGVTTDTVDTVATESNTVMSRTSFDSREWEILDYCSPMYPNTPEGASQYIQSLKLTQSDIVISEFMPVNHVGITDSDGAYSDWIEIKNCSGTPVNLKNYSVSNNLDTPYMWQLPNITIKAGESLIIFASGKDSGKATAELHANFKLNSTKGDVVLCNSDGKIIDSTSYAEAAACASYERVSDTVYSETFSPTPGYDNTESGYESAYAAINAGKTELVIYEAMSKNQSYIRQNGAQYYDWVTIKNMSDHSVDLKNFYMTDDSQDTAKWQMPSITLSSGETCTFIASGSSTLSNTTYYHTNFKINNDEEVFITDGSKVIDGACLKATAVDESYGRIDGKNGMYYFSTPTPNTDNPSTGAWAVAGTPMISTASGVFNDSDGVTVSISGSGEIYYSTDGTTPTRTNGIKYTGAITFTETTNVRAVSYDGTKQKSPVASATYVINENHTLPVMTLSVDYDDMFSESKGINAYGYNYNNYIPYEGANFWQDWEREAYAEYFEDGEAGFSIKCGIKVFGAYSRFIDKKSFQLKFRDLYGQGELQYSVFDSMPDINSFEALVLRSGSQDWIHTLFRDEWLTSLMQNNSEYMYTQAYQPCVLYINGQYWGIYFFREKINSDYVSKHFNVPSDSVNLLVANTAVISGSNTEYKELLTYVETHSMKVDEYYQYVLSQIDYMNYIDYFIAEIYSGNQDTGNIKFFKSDDAESDNKWHWIYYDLDWAFYYNTSVHFYIRAEGKPGFRRITTIMNRLLNNDEFRDMFLKRFAYHLKTTFSPEVANTRIDELCAEVEPEMARECARWNKRMTRWESEVTSLKSKVEAKRAILIDDLCNEFGLTNSEREYYFGDVL